MQDMEQYKSKVKKNIENLINSNALEDAKKIIKEYKELVNNDVDIYSFEGVIAMLEDNMDKAEIILKRGNTLYVKIVLIYYIISAIYMNLLITMNWP
ncbi:M3 family oligoendopeptidase [Clostridium sporogenes]|uniref:M3 family oligoendopeptidase n=1 Tax=Clostridium sporogenes TaxID=1509 RepID=UPI0013D085F1|nr:M3 family oligoendopeptidase [Clostridium sporogenes]